MSGVTPFNALGGQQDEDIGDLEVRIKARFPADLAAQPQVGFQRDYLTAEGAIHGELLYPLWQDAVAAARRYRQVVATQRYVKGKEVFPATPVTFRYFREASDRFAHQDGRPYQIGEAITDHPVDLTHPALITYGVGIAEALIDPDRPFAEGETYFSDYAPPLMEPLRFQ